MNPLLLAVLATALTFLLGYLLGTRIGEKRGRDLEWADEYFAGIAADRARRNRLGQFKHKG